MQAEANPQFLHDLAEFSLRFTCDHCRHFVPEAEACAHEWPTEEHRLPLRGVVVFCKEFELS
jgi:hypothetical protein